MESFYTIKEEVFRHLKIIADNPYAIFVLAFLFGLEAIIIAGKVFTYMSTYMSTPTQPRPSSTTLITKHLHSRKHHQSRHTNIHIAATWSSDQKYANICVELIQNAPSLYHRAQAINHQLKPHRITPFHRACINGNISLIKFMLENGANINLTTACGDTPFYLAVFGFIKNHFDLEVLELLYYHMCSINHPKNHGYTPLHLAAQVGDVELIKWLVAHGADVEAKTVCMHTPCDVARIEGHVTAAVLLEVHTSAPPCSVAAPPYSATASPRLSYRQNVDNYSREELFFK